LKATVSTYLPQLNDALGQTGILKVYYFNGAAASQKYSGNWGPNWSNRSYIEQTLFQEGNPPVTINPSGGTPIGDAICDAIQGSAAANNRTILLFTDGYQTKYPVPPAAASIWITVRTTKLKFLPSAPPVAMPLCYRCWPSRMDSLHNRIQEVRPN
jgi:hypothetical protein